MSPRKLYVVDIADVDQPMDLPMVIRRLNVHKSKISSTNWKEFSHWRQEHFVFSVEPAQMTDVMGVVSMKAMNISLVQWSCQRASAVKGCMRIFSPSNCRLIQWHWELWEPIIVIKLGFTYSFMNGYSESLSCYIVYRVSLMFV